MTPEEEQAILAYLFENGLLQMPMNKYGETEPIDLSVQGQGINVYQDMLTSQSDQANAMNAMGGGAGAYAPGALDPQIDEWDPIKTPQADTLRYMSTLGGLEGWKAKVLMDSKTPSQIATMIRVAYDDPEGALADGMPADVVAEIRGGGLPMIAGAYGQAGTEVDWNAVTKDISGTAMPFYQEQGLLQQPNVRQVNGRYFTEKPSAQMEWLRKQGYSDPREEYSVEMLAQGDDDLTRLVSGASEKASAYDTAAKRYDDEMKAIKRFNRGGPQAHQAAMEGQIQAMKRLTGKAVDTFGNLREMAANPNPAPIDNRPAYLRGGQPQPQVQMGDSGLSDLLAELESFRDTTKYRNQRLQATAPMPTTTRRDAGIRKRGVEKQSGAAAFALAKQLVPMFTAQRSGRTPYLDQKEARLNELRQMGLIR